MNNNGAMPNPEENMRLSAEFEASFQSAIILSVKGLPGVADFLAQSSGQPNDAELIELLRKELSLKLQSPRVAAQYGTDSIVVGMAREFQRLPKDIWYDLAILEWRLSLAVGRMFPLEEFLEQLKPVVVRLDSLRAAISESGQQAKSPIESIVGTMTPGTVLDRFRIIQLIGVGGMGVVYEAEEIEGLHRRVALKVLRSDVESRDVHSRFELEGQILAIMDHPNIVRRPAARCDRGGIPR